MKFRSFFQEEKNEFEEEYFEMEDFDELGMRNIFKDDYKIAMEACLNFMEKCKLYIEDKDIISHNDWKSSSAIYCECGRSPFWLRIVIDTTSSRTISVMSELKYVDNAFCRVWYVGTTRDDAIHTYDEEEAIKVFDEYCDKLL